MMWRQQTFKQASLGTNKPSSKQALAPAKSSKPWHQQASSKQALAPASLQASKPWHQQAYHHDVMWIDPKPYRLSACDTM